MARVAEPEERGRVQGFADLMTMTTVAAASLSAGAIHSQLGWEALSLAALGPLIAGMRRPALARVIRGAKTARRLIGDGCVTRRSRSCDG
ncbi:MAG: hypothetical protein CM15mP115_10560 [Alphaproteobacteria bacterium]|nr:MAG: hypothetical protein CM15mP115_10560 [Alphaproteobacteria bacterium]